MFYSVLCTLLLSDSSKILNNEQIDVQRDNPQIKTDNAEKLCIS